MLSPLDIHNREFRRGLRGYQEDEVDGFLDEVVRDFEMLLKERDQLHEEIEELNRRLDQYKLLEDNLHKALLVAEKTADEVKRNAEKEAELIVREARNEADRIQDEARAKLRSLEGEWNDRRNAYEMWKDKVRGLIQSELRLLNDQAGQEAMASQD